MIKSKKISSRLLALLIITILLMANFIFLEKSTASAAGFYWNKYNLEQYVTPRVLKKKNKVVCKDTRSFNFSNSGTHSENACLYPWGWGVSEENKVVSRDITRNKICESSMILFEEMEEGDENGKISKKTGNLVKEVKLLQTYLSWLNLYTGPVNGIFSQEVTKSVQDVQASLGVEETGRIDFKTIDEFFKACD